MVCNFTVYCILEMSANKSNRGVSAQGDVHPLPIACWDTPSNSWIEFLTHACENITFPQLLLRAIIKHSDTDLIGLVIKSYSGRRQQFGNNSKTNNIASICPTFQTEFNSVNQLQSPSHLQIELQSFGKRN